MLLCAPFSVWIFPISNCWNVQNWMFLREDLSERLRKALPVVPKWVDGALTLDEERIYLQNTLFNSCTFAYELEIKSKNWMVLRVV